MAQEPGPGSWLPLPRWSDAEGLHSTDLPRNGTLATTSLSVMAGVEIGPTP
jgi:hypothetical protein